MKEQINEKHDKLLIAFLVFSGCTKEENPIETGGETDQQITEYFNYKIGNTYNYKSIIFDNHNNPLFELERKSTLSSQVEIGEKKYFVFDEELKVDNSTTSHEIFLNFNGTKLEQLVDTSGAALLLPDSLKDTVILELVEASTIFKYPIKVGESWDVFLGDIVLGTFKINVISITAEYTGVEQIDLGPNFGTVASEKVTYTVLLNFPDMSNPFLPNKQYYYADIWFSKGLGLVKFSGSKFFTNFLVGGDISMSDTLRVETQIRY